MDYKPRVLVGAPTSDVKEYCQEHYLKSICNLTYENYEVYLCDNSKTVDNSYHLRSQGIECSWLNPKGKSQVQFIAESHERVRQYAIKNGYDYWLHLESDVIPPSNIIERLLMHKKMMVSGMYHIGFGANRHLMVQLLEKHGKIHLKSYNVDQGELLLVDGNVKEVFHAGLGCALIHRTIFSRIKFRYMPMVAAHPDTFFSHDLYNQRINQFVDTSVLCKHLNSPYQHY